MLKRLTSIRGARKQPQIGALATYLASLLLLALGTAVALWLETHVWLVGAWFVIFVLVLLLETWTLRKPSGRTWIELMLSVIVGLVWAIPFAVWFEARSADTQLLLVVFSVLSALCSVLLKQNGPARSLITVGWALPLAFVVLWQSNAQAISYSSLGVLSAWMIVLVLGWLLGWSSNQRHRFLTERALLLDNLEAKIAELERARADEKKARAVADKANKDKSSFLAMISHDLRQPIYAANLMLETAQHAEDKKIEHGDLQQIQSSLGELTIYVESLLDTAMLDSGEMRANLKVFSLPSLGRQLQAEFEDMSAKHKMDVQIELSNLLVRSDQMLLGRILRNLVANALYHSGGTSIRVVSTVQGDTVQISIEDDGSGLPPEIHTSFDDESTDVQSSSDQTGKDRRGLGLSIVKRLCSLLALSIRSVNVNTGTRFEISSLNILSGENAVGTNELPTMPHDGKTIVIIDDDELLLRHLTNLLEKWGYNVHASKDELPDLVIPHLVIADFDLASERDGIDVIEEARKRWGDALAAFVITGSTSTTVVERVNKAGVQLVQKPIRPAELKSIILTELS